MVDKHMAFKIMKNIRELHYEYLLARVIFYPAVYVRRVFINFKEKQKKIVVNNLINMLRVDPVLNVEEFNGVFSMDSRSHIFERLVSKGEYEPELVKYCNLMIDKNRDVIDVGANIGFFTVLFAKIIDGNKKVLSIEPTKKALNRLKKNIELNVVKDNVIIFEGVAADKKGNVDIKTILGKEEYSSMGEMAHNSILNEEYVVEKVKGLTIDELVKINKLDPGFIKIDVEGVEHLIFEGAKMVLKNNRPIILSELSNYLLNRNGSSAKNVIDYLKQFNYTVIDPIDSKIELGKKDYGDMLCIPNEIVSEFNNIIEMKS